MWQIDSVIINERKYPFVDFSITLNVPIVVSVGKIFVPCSAQSHVFVIQVTIRQLPKVPATILQNSVSVFDRTARVDVPSNVSITLNNMIEVLDTSRFVVLLKTPQGSQYFGRILEISSTAAQA
jgi:hypothetical protein